MFSNKNMRLLVVLLVAGVVMAACTTPAAPETAAPTEAATTAPTEAATAAPTEAAPAFEGLEVTGPDCEKQAGLPSPIHSIKATDANTVVFELCNPDAAFLYKVALTNFSVIPAAYLEKTGGTGDLVQQPVGTGPYKFSEWKHGESITMERFDDYWGEKAKTQTMIMRWGTENAARLNELRAGTVDGLDNLGPSDFEAVKADPAFKTYERVPMNVGYLGLPNTYKPFDDVHVRRAIAMAIDRERVVKNFFPPGSAAVDYFTPCNIANGCVGDPWYKFDVAAAKAELAQATDPAVRNGFTTKLFLRDRARAYQPEPQPLAQEYAAQLKANLNITVEIEVQESGTFLENANKGVLDGIVMLGWLADYPHITNFLDAHFNSTGKTFGTPYPEIFDLLQQGAQIADPKEAEPTYVKANNAVRDLVPMVPIAIGGSAVVYKADVEGGYASPLSNEVFATMTPGDRDTFIFMTNAEAPGLYCGDEDDGEAIRVCEQMFEPLYDFVPGKTDVIPALATECKPDAELKVWTCTLREGVKFHDGTTMNANDVVTSFVVMWDASNPLHKGNTGVWYYIDTLFGIVNKPAS